MILIKSYIEILEYDSYLRIVYYVLRNNMRYCTAIVYIDLPLKIHYTVHNKDKSTK